MGTPELARDCLAALYAKDGCEIAGVLTRPDKQKGRGMKFIPSPVKEFALEKEIPVFQHATLRNHAFEKELRELDPDLIIVAAYGCILPGYVLDYPVHGCVNAHASLLPKYRGASPIQRAIMEGEKVTGITAMFMDEGLDTGDIIRKYECPIEDGDNCGTLTEKLSALAGRAMCDVVDMIADGTVTREKQDGFSATYASKIEKEDTILDFGEGAERTLNRIRGLSPQPGCLTRTAGGMLLKIQGAVASDEDPGENAPGTVVRLDGTGRGGIHVSCGDACVCLTSLTPEGQKPMGAGEFVRGRKISEGEILKY